MNDKGERIPNIGELHAIEYLCCLDKQLTDAQGPQKDWLRQIPNGWRDFRMVQSVMEKLIGKLYETLPDKTMRHIIHLANHGQIVIRPRPAIPLKEKTQFMTDEDLTMLVNTVIENQCAMCVNDAQAQKKCKLRKTLENVAPTEAVHRNGLCSYRDVAAGNPLGDYV